MCGIVGVCNLRGDRSVPRAGIDLALARLARRGPDAEGIFDGPGVVLGHRRLAVIDVEGGPQPWVDPDTDVVVVFNGEIYNHRRLRPVLEARGHRFRSQCDTEVLCKAYVEWGVDCVEHLEGMFAFAVVDARHDRLFLARDRLGIKPLYVSLDDDRLAFASSVAALRALPGVSGRLDLGAVSHYLTTIRATLGRRTLLADVQQLLPGERLTADLTTGRVRIHRWWDLPAIPAQDKLPTTVEQAAKELRRLLDDAVTDRLIADVPLGGFLSGGIDSAAIAAVAAAARDRDFQTYSVGYDREGFHEWPFVRQVVRALGIPNQEIVLDEPDYVETWMGLVAEKGLPLSTPNEVGIYHLAAALRQTCTVALTGEGSDEVLAGYGLPYFSAHDFDRSANAPTAAQVRALQRAYGRDEFPTRTEHYLAVNSYVPLGSQRQLFDAGVWDRMATEQAVRSHYDDLLGRFADCTTLDAYLHVHARINLEGLLSRVDSSTMAASVEARVPFCDHRVAEFAFALPDDVKIDWRSRLARRRGADLNVFEICEQDLIETKKVLRQAFGRELPEPILHRPKMSFPTPIVSAFAGPLASTVDAIIDASPLVGTLFDPRAVRHMAPKHAGFWPIVNLCLWSLNEDQPIFV